MREVKKKGDLESLDVDGQDGHEESVSEEPVSDEDDDGKGAELAYGASVGTGRGTEDGDGAEDGVVGDDLEGV